jgi:hypothetical protein
MAEYIERSAALDKLDEALVRSIESGGSHEASGLVTAKCQIAAVPAADVVAVRHGTWYHGKEQGAVYAKCSACGRKMNYSCYGYAYCALCGAKMDGERREE